MISDPSSYRTLTRGMAALLWVAGALVFLAGIQLFLLAERTDRFFAWTIDPPLTAAFLGASYWSSAVFEWSAARRRYWAEARIAVPGVFVFTTVTLIVSLIHLDKFHFGPDFQTVTSIVTWLWMAIYTSVPVMMAVLWFRQQRLPSGDPPAGAPLSAWLRLLLGLHALVLGGVGVALLVAPASAAELWPWQLTPLTGRAVGAWLLSLAVVAAHSMAENSALRVRPAGWAYLAFALLQGLAVVRYPDVVAWASARGGGYVAFLVTALAIGVGLVTRARGADQIPR